MIRRTLFILAFVPGIAAAQTTNCQWIGRTWSCQSTGQFQSGMPSFDYGAAERQRLQQQALMAQQQAQQQQQAQMWSQIIESQRQRRAARDQQVEDSYAQAQTEIAQERQLLLNEQVSQLLKTGDCPGAQAKALGAGDIDLALKAKQFCSVSAATATP